MPGTEANVGESGVLNYNFGRNPWTRAPVIGQASGFRNPLMDPQNAGVVLFDVPGAATNVHRVFLRPLEVRVECDITVINDHSVRMTLDEITFSGPPGLTFP
jgi:hypothetical protein